MAVFFFAKSFDEFHVNLENPMMGGESGFNLYDYPYSDSLSFVIVKAIGLFTDNPFLIINLFYFLCSFITAIIAFFVIEKYLNIAPLSVCLGLLYANSWFFQARLEHIWLVPYFFLPVACSLGIDIIDGTLIENHVALWKKKSLYKAMVLAFCCAFTGLYYAYFSCAIIAASMVIRWINSRRIIENLYPVLLIFATGTGVILNVLPNLIYWMRNGMNPESEVAVRSGSDAEVYGLKVIQMLLPRSGHRIGKFAALTQWYNKNYPLVNENVTSSIGIVASIGFVIALIWLFGTNIKKTYSYLIVSTLLIATVGGISSMISLVINIPVRCYNRMSLIVMFLSLLCLGLWIKRILNNISIWKTIVVSIMILFVGIYDQTQAVGPIDYSMIDDTREFIEKIESDIGSEGYVFELPYVRWPSGGNYRMFTGYLFSKELHWSYGAMQGRDEAKWQKRTALLEVDEMVRELMNHDYDGIYVDMEAYNQIMGDGKFDILYERLTDMLRQEPIVNAEKNLYFWRLQKGVGGAPLLDTAA